MSADINFWLEHSKNTCCNMSNVDFIRGKVGWIKHVGREISNSWTETTSKMFWSLWDGGIGTGKLEGICENQCTNWYNACKFDYFSGDKRSNELGSGDISFWSKNSLYCSQLNDIYDNPLDFWSQMGIKVNTDSDKCYDGTPWSVKFGRAVKTEPRKFKDKQKSKSKTELTLTDQILGPLADFYHTYPTIFIIVYGGVFFIVGAYALTFILSQLRFFNNSADQTEVDERIRQKRLDKLERKKRNKES